MMYLNAIQKFVDSITPMSESGWAVSLAADAADGSLYCADSLEEAARNAWVALKANKVELPALSDEVMLGVPFEAFERICMVIKDGPVANPFYSALVWTKEGEACYHDTSSRTPERAFELCHELASIPYGPVSREVSHA